jgi:hypothetical protein
VRYARKWQDGEGLKLISKRQSDFLDLLQRYFGNWHDNEVMKQWMQRKAKQYKARGNSQLFKRAISIIEEDSKRFIEWSNQLLERAPMILQPLANRLARLKEKEQHSGKSSRLLRAT